MIPRERLTGQNRGGGGEDKIAFFSTPLPVASPPPPLPPLVYSIAFMIMMAAAINVPLGRAFDTKRLLCRLASRRSYLTPIWNNPAL